MPQRNKKQGFTLIEMMVVIAIVALIVAIVIPTVTVAIEKSRAVTDASNLRSLLAEANVVVFGGAKQDALASLSEDAMPSKTFPEASLKIVYSEPGFVNVYYVVGSQYYSLDYFANIAEEGNKEISTAKPVFPDRYSEEWITVYTP